MNPAHSSRHHAWNVSAREAVEVQRRLAALVRTENMLETVRTVAGVDVSVRSGLSRAAAVVLTYPGLAPLDEAVAERPTEFPYISGLLTFREGPVIVEALKALDLRPDVIIFDGQGAAHPRRLGVASHLGVILDRPTIGCAKTRLCGEYKEPGPEKGARADLVDRGEVVGAALRTRANVKPVFVSAGHGVDLDTAVDIVLTCCPRYRLPETTRRAHNLAGRR